MADPPPCDTAPYVTRIVEAAGDRAEGGRRHPRLRRLLRRRRRSCSTTRRRSTSGSRKPAGAVELLAKFRDALAERRAVHGRAVGDSGCTSSSPPKGIKIGDIVHAVRVAVTGKAVGFGLFDTLAILGRERCLARIDRALCERVSRTRGTSPPANEHFIRYPPRSTASCSSG